LCNLHCSLAYAAHHPTRQDNARIAADPGIASYVVSMPISVHRLGEGRYAAEVSPPHGAQPWRTDGMSQHELIDALQRLGCHQTDIGDALEEADPGWVKRQREP
jgi:hypothetical protein